MSSSGRDYTYYRDRRQQDQPERVKNINRRIALAEVIGINLQGRAVGVLVGRTRDLGFAQQFWW